MSCIISLGNANVNLQASVCKHASAVFIHSHTSLLWVNMILACEKHSHAADEQGNMWKWRSSAAAPTGNQLSFDFLINLCHQHKQGLEIEVCFIEPRRSLAQLKQLKLLIRQSIACAVHGQSFADGCLYLFQAVFGEIAVLAWVRLFILPDSQIPGCVLGLHTPERDSQYTRWSKWTEYQ